MAGEFTAAKRISAINELNLAKVKVSDNVNLSYEFKDGWNHWFMELESGENIDDPTIPGRYINASQRIPMDRLVYRDPVSGIIYTSELPSYIDDMVYGHLDTSVSGQATFITEDYRVDPQDNEHETDESQDKYRLGEYVSPRNSGQIPTQMIFVETDPSAGYQTKYIYVPAMKDINTGICAYGFVRITRSEISPGDWVVIVGDDEYNESERNVRLVRANVVYFSPCSTPKPIYKTGNGIFTEVDNIVVNHDAEYLVRGDGHPVPYSAITKQCANNVITFENLANTTYKIGLTLRAKRHSSTPFPVYSELKLETVKGSTAETVATADVDMAMVDGDYQAVNLVGTVSVTDGTLKIRLTSEGSDLTLDVLCDGGYIVELI